MKGLIRSYKKGDKRRAELIHARRRFRGRYEVNPTDDQYRNMINQIQDNPPLAEFIKTQSNARTHWVVRFGDIRIPVVYNKGSKLIITALPKEVLHEFDKLKKENEIDNCNVAENVVRLDARRHRLSA